MASLTRKLRGDIAQLRRWLRHLLRGEPDWVTKKRRTDPEFDAAHGVDTGGITDLRGLTISSTSRRDGHIHAAVDPEEFATALKALPIDHSQFTFIDYGAGKGRAMMLAAANPFRRVIGVEFAAELVDVARQNLTAAAASGSLTAPTEIVLGDVLEHRLPDEPIVLFLYNPFNGVVMRKVAQNAARSIRDLPRPFFVLYLNPFEIDAWIEEGFEVVERAPHFAIIARP